MRSHSPDQRSRQADATSSALYATAERPTAVLVDASPLLDARRTAGIGRYVSSLLEALTAVQNIKVTVTRPQAPARESWSERFVAAQHGLLAALRHLSPDVVHSAVSEPLVGWPLRSQVVTLHDAIPWLASPHDPAHQCHLACQRRRLQQCGAVIAVSEAVNRDAGAVLGIEPGRVPYTGGSQRGLLRAPSRRRPRAAPGSRREQRGLRALGWKPQSPRPA